MTIGTGAGASGGFVTGFGNAAIQNKNVGEMFDAGINDAIIGGISGGILGGIVGGIDAYIDDRSFWTGELPKGGDQTIWGEISIKARGAGKGSLSTDGHSWIETTDVDGNVTSYGTWGNQGEEEFLTNFKGDLGSPSNALQTEKITYAQKARLDNFIGKDANRNWTVFRNCSNFSSRAFNYTTGMNVMPHPFMFPIYTPSWLVRTIR